MKKYALLTTTLLWTATTSAREPADRAAPEAFRRGHSKHGDAFDVGPRERPWVMEGIGATHFPITTSSPEVQKWFDQGNTLLHNFWYHEAERAFRWCLKLEPENAMAYWGLVRTTRAYDTGNQDRDAAFMKEAVKLKQKVSERERAYIEAYEVLYEPDTGQAEKPTKREKFQTALERIVLKYPEDVEAKALLAIETLFASDRVGRDLLLKEIIAKAPDHPGAHHYRIHIWDGPDGMQALDSAARYGQIAPQVGHALHMPGHTYSGVGMWHEAAIAMDAATRAEQRYMHDRMVFPFNTWNYAHNRNYLSYIQEQLGMAEAAISGARQVMAAPLDPKYNNPDGYGPYFQGLLARMRALIKFERWREILDPKTFLWRDATRDKMYRAYCETMAHLGLANVEKATESLARHTALRREIEKEENKWLEERYTIQSLETRGLLALAKGDPLGGIELLSQPPIRRRRCGSRTTTLRFTRTSSTRRSAGLTSRREAPRSRRGPSRRRST